MNKKESILDKIKFITDSASNNLEAIQKNNEAVPFLVRMKQESEMLRDIVISLPVDLVEKKGDNLLQNVNSQYNYYNKNIPTINTIDLSVAPTSTAIMASGCAVAMNIILTNDDQLQELYSDWPVVNNYKKYLDTNKRIDEIIEYFNKIDESLPIKISEINDLYKKYMAHSGMLGKVNNR